MRIFGTERRPAHQTLKHDCASGPPITRESITLATKDFRSDVIWSPNCGIGHNATGLAPSVDLRSIANGKIDLVKGDGVAVARLV